MSREQCTGTERQGGVSADLLEAKLLGPQAEPHDCGGLEPPAMNTAHCSGPHPELRDVPAKRGSWRV